MAADQTQNEAKFIPSPEHIVFAEAYIIAKGNISEACKAIGDDNRNIYYGKPNGYRNIEGFENWLSEYAKKEVLKRTGKWYLIAEKYAEEGSYQHLNMLMQIAKEFSPKEPSQSFTIITQENRYKGIKDEDLNAILEGYLKRR